MHVQQNFHFARIFFPRKKVEVVYALSPLVTGKKQTSCFSGICHVIKTKKDKTKFRIAGTEV